MYFMSLCDARFTKIRGKPIHNINYSRGCVPPLLGSGIYRSTQFAVFEAVYTYCDEHPILKKEIPGTFGIQA